MAAECGGVVGGDDTLAPTTPLQRAAACAARVARDALAAAIVALGGAWIAGAGVAAVYQAGA